MMAETKPVVDRPDSVTHWTCPENEWGDTHHIGSTARCVYCGESVSDLRVAQAKVSS